MVHQDKDNQLWLLNVADKSDKLIASTRTSDDSDPQFNYVRWSPAYDLSIGATLTGSGRTYAQPKQFEGALCFLYHNEGNGKFKDVSADSGVQVFEKLGTEPDWEVIALHVSAIARAAFAEDEAIRMGNMVARELEVLVHHKLQETKALMAG